jgi:GDP-L-fucose synthase|tara:strand:+ start:5516 stop:6481 length:966 start_codon:yes stop_codon:yes gene_type:complete
MNHNSKIYVAGHNGLAGSAILYNLKEAGFKNIIVKSHDELDLTDQLVTSNFFKTEKPEYVFLAAGKVGGIYANTLFPADFIYQNIAIQSNVIHQSYLQGVKRLLFLGSSCIYPRDCKQPIKEEYILSGPLEKSNSPYALAKISGIEMCSSYNRQYKTKYLAAMPTNLYGPGDNYDLQSGHVIAALIRKFAEATKSNTESIEVWGSGKPKREFLCSTDLAEACVFLMNLVDEKFNSLLKNDLSENLYPIINVGAGEDISIKDLSLLIAKISGFKGQVIFDNTKLDGTPRKLLNVDVLTKLGWTPKISISDGIKKALQDFSYS